MLDTTFESTSRHARKPATIAAADRDLIHLAATALLFHLVRAARHPPAAGPSRTDARPTSAG